MFLVYDESQKRIKKDNPDADEIIATINALNNDDRTLVQVGLSDRLLSITGGADGRVLVLYRGHRKNGEVFGRLIDNDYPNQSDEIEIKTNNDWEIEFAYRSVAKETALTVAQYYIEHGDIPETLTWVSD